MPTFKDLQSLYKHIENEAAKAMPKVAEHAVEKTKEQLDAEVYNAYQPTFYERTMEVRESIESLPVTRNGNEVLSTVYSNPNKIHSYSPNQHHSVVSSYEPQDYSSLVVKTIVDGTSGLIFGEGNWTEPHPFFDDAKAKLESSGSHVDVMKKALKSQGIDVK